MYYYETKAVHKKCRGRFTCLLVLVFIYFLELQVQYSFFSVYLSDTVLQQEPIPAKKEETIYPIWVPLLTSLITVSAVVLIVIVVIKFKCFKHKMGKVLPSCFKKDIEYKSDEEMDGYPTTSLNKDKYIVQNEYGNGKSQFQFRLKIYPSYILH